MRWSGAWTPVWSGSAEDRPIPIHDRLTTTSSIVSQDTSSRRDLSGGPSNADAQARLNASGQSTGDTAVGHDDWGAAVAEGSEVLAPYRVEVTEGQVAEPGQKDGVVPWMQGALQALGYSLARSGTFDGPTEAAFQEFQRLNGGAVTGVLGPDELDLLERAIEATISLTEFQENAPGIPASTLAEYLPHLNASMLTANITSDTRKAVYIAQLGHESDGFNTLEEYASGRVWFTH